jgi:four helix bundle protein
VLFRTGTERLPGRGGGVEIAFAERVARHFSELICWQLARELQREVFRVTSTPKLRDNFKLRDQLRDAASSARRNIAEGFGRTSHREFARFLNISLSSVNEVEDGLIECVDDGYVTASEIVVAQRFCRRATIATSRLRNTLKDKPGGPQ